MSAVVITGKEELVLDELPVPQPGPDEVRIRTAYVGICGSDLHYYFEGRNGSFIVKEPLVPGHEMSGTVDYDPSGTYQEGEPVTVHPATFGDPIEGLGDKPHLWPNGAYLGSASTWPHTQGAMTPYFLVKRSVLHRLPASLPLTRAALAEPLSVALHGIEQAGGVQGKRVLVTGAGAIGLLAAAAAVILGASEVTATDVLPGPLARAREVGVTHAVDVSTTALEDDAYDVVLECAGIPVAITMAFRACVRAGTVVQVGMLPDADSPVNLAPMISKELTVRGSFRFNDELDHAIELLTDNEVFDRVVTHTFAAPDAREAFDVAKNSELSGKVLVALDPSTKETP